MPETTSNSSTRPAISIVVPIYNVEDYLRECLDSIQAQTFTDIEVICVNDGSTDSSLQIMKSYEQADERFRVIDKPNGGYGHSVNRGISEAHGEYLSIIEPDDIIDPNMMGDLYSATVLADGSKAQIVKSSYWEYFDLEDGTRPYIEEPNLMGFMPKCEMIIDLKKNCEVLHHHPSIWTAIYLREFIDAKGIRMIEPKGAGWADNPWFYETLLQADTIVWLPYPYYYYRQTNPNASSKKLDYHVPFDRLRDLRGILTRLGIKDERILESFYNRTFNYVITTLIEEFEYPETNPEFKALMREAFQDMDIEVLTTSGQGIIKKGLVYYDRTMGTNYAVEKTPSNVATVKVSAATSPKMTFVLPIGKGVGWLAGRCEELRKRKKSDFEVLLVGSDLDDDVIEEAAEQVSRDGRYRYLGSYETDAEAYNTCIDEAKGTYIQFFAPYNRIHKKTSDHMMEFANAARGEDVIVLTDNPAVLRRFVDVDELIKPDKKGGPRKRLDGVIARSPMQGFTPILSVCNSNWSHRYIYRTDCLRSNGVRFDEDDSESFWGFSVYALSSCDKAIIAFEDEVFVEDDFFPPAKEDAEDALADSLKWLDVAEKAAAKQESDALRNSCRIAALFNVLIRFMPSDVSEESYDLARSKWQEWNMDLASPRSCVDFEAYKRVRTAMNEESFDTYLLRLFRGVSMSDIYARKRAKKLARKRRDLKESSSYKLGNKIVRPVKRIVSR